MSKNDQTYFKNLKVFTPQGHLAIFQYNAWRDKQFCTNFPVLNKYPIQLTITCLKSTLETLEEGVKYVQS